MIIETKPDGTKRSKSITADEVEEHGAPECTCGTAFEKVGSHLKAMEFEDNAFDVRILTFVPDCVCWQST